jgi:hypothetical protein
MQLALETTGWHDRSRKARRAPSKIPNMSKFSVMDVALLSTAVLARLALPCDSCRSVNDLPT